MLHRRPTAETHSRFQVLDTQPREVPHNNPKSAFPSSPHFRVINRRPSFTAPLPGMQQTILSLVRVSWPGGAARLLGP